MLTLPMAAFAQRPATPPDGTAELLKPVVEGFFRGLAGGYELEVVPPYGFILGQNLVALVRWTTPSWYGHSCINGGRIAFPGFPMTRVCPTSKAAT
jgi:hypothetical protein